MPPEDCCLQIEHLFADARTVSSRHFRQDRADAADSCESARGDGVH